MSTDSGGSPKKLTTAEILAKARAEKAAKAQADAAAAGGEAPAAPVEAAAPASEAAAEAPAAPAAKPGSTANILAAARAAAAAKAGGATPAAPAAPVVPAGDAGKPKSTAEILAAARANKAAAAGGSPAATPASAAATPASAAATPAATKPVAAAGPKPSVQEMLAAVRAGQPASSGAAATAAPAVAAKVTAPPMPVKPQPPAPKKAATADTRRNFLSAALVVCLSPFWVAWASFTAATLASTLAMLRFMLPNVLTEPPSKFKVGSPADFDLGTVSEKFKAQFGIWLVHTDKYQGKNLIYALSTVCTHLGCTPSWLDGEQKYKCPCHGSGFYINGINFEGPAPRPLERVGIRIAEDGMLEVDKSLKFQEEMGQWADPASYVEIS